MDSITRLNELIPKYINNKNEFDSYKQVVEKDKNEIKKLLGEIGKSEWTVGTNKVVVQERTSQVMDEEKLVEYLKSIHAESCIKVVESINEDALENAIYHGIITKEQVQEMDKFISEKKTFALKVAKVNKG